MANYYCSHEERYNEEDRYRLAISLIKTIQRRGRIKTISYDSEKLPKDCGYIMYSNHQGRYDALGIMTSHTEPCSVVIDSERSKIMLLNHVVKLVKGKRLIRNNYHQQYQELHALVDEVKNGRKYIYFPEGGYDHNGNKMQEFHTGAFKCAMKAKAPIVPVAIYDSYLAFDFNSLRRITTQVCFLDPIFYEDYADMTSKEISNLVKERIQEKINELETIRNEKGYNHKLIQKSV